VQAALAGDASAQDVGAAVGGFGVVSASVHAVGPVFTSRIREAASRRIAVNASSKRRSRPATDVVRVR